MRRCAAQQQRAAAAKQQVHGPQQLPQRAQESHAAAERAAAEGEMPSGMLMLAALLTPLLLDAEPAHADNSLLTGKTVSLVRSEGVTKTSSRTWSLLAEAISADVYT